MDTALVVCRDPGERATYGGWLRGAGYAVAEAASAEVAVAGSRDTPPALVLAEIAATAAAVALARAVRAGDPRAIVLMLSGGDSVEAAVAALKAGATDVLVRPLTRAALLARLPARPETAPVIARSAAMRECLALAARAAACDVAVLVTGESGTGKEVLARAVHAGGPRATGPLVPVNCAAIPDALLESELFGHRRGAFTGAHADRPGLLAAAEGGTLFLDEVGELPLALQPKLLRVLQDGTYCPVGHHRPRGADVRVVAATNAELRARVEAGTFRADLFYRLAAFPIHLPPLRERPEDVEPLARHFVATRRAALGRPDAELASDAVTYLAARPWPGNVRELANAVERALLVGAGRRLSADDFRRLDAGDTPRPEVPWRLPADGIDLPGLVRALVAAALERTSGNVSAAARLLALSRPALRYRARRYGLVPAGRRGGAASSQAPCSALRRPPDVPCE